MKPTDIRIGNVVNDNIIVKDINECGVNRKSWADDSDTYDACFDAGDGELIRPVLLTEDWLEKFGFHSKYKSVHMQWTKFTEGADLNFRCFNVNQASDEDDEGNSIEQKQQFWWDFKIELKYVHQLQNLFYALVGQELSLRL